MAVDGSTSVVERVPETSSRSITERITGTYDFEVTNYPELKGMAVDECITSRGFRVGGHDWRIEFYPNGVDADSAGSPACYVQIASRGKDASAKFTLSLLERDGHGQAPIVSRDSVEKVFGREIMNWGFSKFVSKSKLKSLSFRGHGCFTIRCALTVRNESPPLEVLGDLEGMLRDGTGADVTFGVGDGREFHAHRCVLAARSPVFRAQFFDGMMEKDMSRFQVADMDAAIFEMMLHYIYTDSILPRSSDDEGGQGDGDDAVMQHLLVAADRYGLERLKMMCEDELCKRMDVQNVKARFSLAKQHSCKRLEDACIFFMSSPEVLSVVLENVSFNDS